MYSTGAVRPTTDAFGSPGAFRNAVAVKAPVTPKVMIKTPAKYTARECRMDRTGSDSLARFAAIRVETA